MRAALAPILASLLSALIGVGELAAQEPRGFHFTWPFEVELALESGLPVSLSSTGELTTRTVDDVVTIVRPPVPAFRYSGRRLELQSLYRPELELFLENSDLGTLNHAAGARLDYRLTRRLDLNVGDLFRLTHDPSRDLGPNTLLLVRGRFRQNTLFAGLSYRWTRRTRLAARFDEVRTSFDVGTFFRLPRQVNRIWSGSVAHGFGRRDSVAITYSLLDASAPVPRGSEPAVEAGTGFRLRSHNVSLGYQRDLSRNLSFEGSGGLIRSAAANHYSASARLELRLDELRILTGYDRGLAHAAQDRFPGAEPGFTTELVPDSLLEAARFRLDGRLASRWRLDVQAWVARRSPSRVVGPGDLREGETLWGRARLDYWLGQRVSAYAGFEAHQQDASILDEVSVDRRRLLFGIRYGPTVHEAGRERLLSGGSDLSP